MALESRHSEAAEMSASLERKARDSLAMAVEQGWPGDADAVIAAHWALYQA